VGVVVQCEVAPRASGVCFTVDPSGLDRALILEAVPGKGEALVSGRAQPEAWRLYRSGLGGWEGRMDRTDGTPVLLDTQARGLAEAAADLSERFGHPLDLEWAIDEKGVLWWLQARPVTAAAPPRDLDLERYFDGVDDGPVTVWSNWNVREVMPEVFLPLNWSLWREAVIPSVVESLFGTRRGSRLFPHAVPIDLVNGRIYWNMNALMAVPLYGWLVPRGIDRIDARAGTVVRELLARRILRPRRLPGSALLRALGVVATGIRSSLSLLSSLAPRRALRELEECGRDIARRPPLASLESEALIEEMRLLDSPACHRFRVGQQASVTGFLVYLAGEHAFRRYPDAHRLLTAGIPGNPTTMISVGIDDLTEAARGVEDRFREEPPGPELLRRLQDEPRARPFLARLEEFLARFGHRCPGEFDIGAARWSEDPTMILGLVRSRLADPGERVGQRLVRLWWERARAVDAAVASAPFWRRGLLRLLARLVALYMPLREAPKHYAMIAIERMRMAALELGRRLAGSGHVDSREDVFFLESEEIRALIGGKALKEEPHALIESRRERWARHRAESAPDFVRSDGVPVVEATLEPDAAGTLSGTPASCGSAVGIVRILTAPDPLALEPGEVLVAAFADPGWTPLFPRAGAVVMEVGGAMCHAAVVARELGIPAVFGVAGATRRLRDGQRVRVDGDRGRVVFLDESLSI
jgi:phosphohistidine swiveling domain-containing protein